MIKLKSATGFDWTIRLTDISAVRWEGALGTTKFGARVYMYSGLEIPFEGEEAVRLFRVYFQGRQDGG